MHGRLDAPLSPKGIEQVLSRAQAFSTDHYDYFYSSPTGRAMQTAGLIGDVLHMQPVALPGLEELDLGRLEGEMRAPAAESIQSRRKNIFNLVKPFGKDSESLLHLFLRCNRVIRRALHAHAGDSILVVSHEIFINMAVRILTGKFFMFFNMQPVGRVKIEVNRWGHGRILPTSDETGSS